MSDTDRIFSGGLGSAPRHRRRGGSLRYLVTPLVLFACVYGWWTTRDTHEPGTFVAADNRYTIAIADVPAKRREVAASAVWAALPPSWGVDGVIAAIRQDMPLPEWLLNHLIGGDCIVVGNDAANFSDVLVITKMRRLGVLFEQGRHFIQAIASDEAGGLNLRHIPEASLYYAVRGRVLLASPSRAALIHALTLRPEDTLGDEALVRTLGEPGAEDMRGVIAFEDAGPLGGIVSTLRFSLRIEPESAHVILGGRLHPNWQARLGGLFEGAGPRALPPPPDGMLTISADFGKPVAELWAALGQATGVPWLSQEAWDGWSTLDEGEEPGMAYFFTQATGRMGPGIALSWRGVDPHEIVPVPLVAAVVEDPGARIEQVLNAFPAIPAEAPPWAPYPRPLESGRGVYLPLIGGGSIEPAAIATGRGLLVSTSRAEALEAAAELAGASPAPPGEGNVFIRMAPRDCVDAIIEAGEVFAEAGALRGYTPESFQTAAATWRERAAAIESATLMGKVEDGAVHIDVQIMCIPGSAEPAE